MAKSSRKQKQKKADFQKVKLKVGRKLPKANVVDTTFKAKKIIIKEQLKVNDKIHLTDRDFKDCLKRLNHYNDSMRMDAVKNLNEMLSTNSPLISANIHQLIEKLSQLFTDKCGSVRKMAVKALSMVVSFVNDEQMIPFFPIIVTHLRCAATHLMSEIPRDALLVIDLLVDRFPQQIKYFSKSLLEDIVNHITNHGTSYSGSRQTTSATHIQSLEKKRKHGSSSTSAITVNVSSKMTSVSWHLQLCYRLEKILSNICKNMSDKPELKENSVQVYKWERNKDLSVSINDYLLSTKKSSNCDRISNYFENLEQLQSVISNLAPLLYEMWIEAGSLNDAMDHTRHSDDQQLEIYGSIMKIYRSIWQLLESWKREDESDLSTWYVKTYGNEILTYCFKVFPLDDKRSNNSRKSTKGNANSPVPMSVQEINLLLCEVMFGFTPWSEEGSAKILLDSCLNYIMELLNNIGSRKPVKIGTILNVVKRYIRLVDNGSSIDILQSLMRLLTNLTPGTADFNAYITFMKDNWVDSYTNIEGSSSWLALLPQSILKCGIIPWNLFCIIKNVAPKMDSEFLNSLESVYPELIKRLPDFQIDNGNVEEAQQITVNMLYWLPSVTVDILYSISKLILKQTISLHFSQSIIEVVVNRYRKMNLSGNTKENCVILSFLLTISIGCSRQMLNDANNCTEKSLSVLTDCYPNHVAIIMDLPECIMHQKGLTEMALKALAELNEETELNTMAEVFLQKLFSDYKVFPLKSVNSLCKMALLLWQADGPPNTILTRFSQIIISYLEILVNDNKLSEFMGSIKDLMRVPGLLPQLVFNHMLHISKNAQDHKAINTLGEIACILSRFSSICYEDTIHSILQSLKSKIDDPEANPRWYAAARYEVQLREERRK